MNQVPEKAISWSVTLCIKTLSSQCNLTAQIEPVQDKQGYTQLWFGLVGFMLFI
jgi:hypothetical protein